MKKAWNGEWHPYAERFPKRSEQEIRVLADDIKENGQAVPCVMTKDGLGIDGRSRVTACKIAGVDPEWIVYEGDNPVARIMSLNLGSRDYTTGQKAMMTAIGLAEQGLRENGKWKYGEVAKAKPEDLDNNQNWSAYVSRAGVVLDFLAAKEIQQVADGDLKLSVAYQQACDKRDQRDRERKHAEKVEQLPSDLKAFVEDGSRDLDDALRENQDRDSVRDIDKIRDSDGAPAPSFEDRVSNGSLTWAEAKQLADQWKQERDESLQRDAARLRDVATGWAALQLVANPNGNPGYVKALRERAGEAVVGKIDEIITQKGTIS